ncbi:hypothetical protein C8R43DRAFT_1243075 [Mycena crocata]|nr:hypothetical protein C8R43DRAFT_1243075 [Mycena crocata]
MALRPLFLLFLSTLVLSQNDSITDISFPDPVVAGDFLHFAYQYHIGKVGHDIKNISAELMVGNAEENGQEVADVMRMPGLISRTHPGINGIDFFYQAHAATPPGNYHVRMNATVYDTLSVSPGQLGTPVSNITARSKTFRMSIAPPPLRIGRPNGGDIFFLSNLSTIGTITVAPYFVDETFDNLKIPSMTPELGRIRYREECGTATLVSHSILMAPSVLTYQPLYETTSAYQYVPVDFFTLSGGAWKIRAKFTSDSHSGNFVALSDEFYIASSGPCVDLQGGNSTTTSGSGSWSSPSRALGSSICGQLDMQSYCRV